MRFKKIVGNNMLMLSYAWKYYKARLLGLFIISIFSAVGALASVLFPKYAVDYLVTDQPFNKYVFLVLIFMFIFLMNIIINNVFSIVVFQKGDNIIKGNVSRELMKKVPSIDMECYENPEFFDKYTRAVSEAENRVISVLNTVQALLSNLFTLGALITTMFILSPITITIAIIGVIFPLWANVKNNKLLLEFENSKTHSNRGVGYINRIFYLAQFAKEIRTTSVGGVLLKKHKRFCEKIDVIIKRFTPKIAKNAIIGSGLFTLFYNGVASIFIGYGIKEGNLTVGDFAALIAAINIVGNNLISVFNIVPECYKHSLFIENFKTILDYSPKIVNNDNSISLITKTPHSFVINNITFTYSNYDKPILKNLSFRICAGEKVAFVGLNGAGKTTMVKLLERLYDPDKGEILIDSQDLRQIKLESIHNSISTVYQDYQYYALTIAENILMRETQGKEDEDIVWSSLERSGLSEKVKNLPKGIYTELTQEFDKEGVMLSGGEIQKLALARMFASDSGIIILDEPSSALDPIAEHEVHQQMIDASDGKTVILISHRLSTARMVDRIFLFKEGSILEEGSHNELMDLNGEYAHMFKLQAEKYLP